MRLLQTARRALLAAMTCLPLVVLAAGTADAQNAKKQTALGKNASVEETDGKSAAAWIVGYIVTATAIALGWTVVMRTNQRADEGESWRG